jgi:predicted metal-dependent enzyme (double-stranded beta helix superfamily)
MSVAQELPGLLRNAGFDAGIYAARDRDEVGGCGRYLLHGDPDPKERFCLQIFAFNPQQKTPIHNHPNECASYIAQGALKERVYELPEAAAAAGHAGQVTKGRKNDRLHPSWAGFDRTELQVPHSLKNHSNSPAVSVHLYRDMDGVSERQQVAAADKFERFKP